MKSHKAPSSCGAARQTSANSAIAPKKNAPDPPPVPAPPGPESDRLPPPSDPDNGENPASDSRAIARPATIAATRGVVTARAAVTADAVVNASGDRAVGALAGIEELTREPGAAMPRRRKLGPRSIDGL